MELKVFRDTLTAAGGLCDTKTELPIETEILIPDYLPQVFKIVKCQVRPVVLQAQTTGGRLTLDGYLRCVVFYQSDEQQNLCQTEQKLPFTKTLDLPAPEYGGCQVHTGGEVEYLNCRAVNQRRVDVRGAFSLNVTLTLRQEQPVITALSGSGAEQLLGTLTGARPVAALDKLITAEEEITFPTPPAAVLDVTGLATVQEIRLLPGKAVIKGEVEARVLYRTAPGCELEQLTRAVPFNQIVDVDGAAEDCRCFAYVEPVGCTLMAAPNPQTPGTVSVTAMLRLRVWRPMECVVVEDAFSTEYNAQVEYKTLTVEQMEAPVDQTVRLTLEGALPDENARILHCFASLAPTEAAQAGPGVMLRGRGTAHVLCLNSLGEIECYDKAFEYQLPDVWEGQIQEYRAECWADVVQCAARKENGGMAADLTLRVTGLMARARQQTVVSEMTCEDPLEPADPDVALRICYAQAGEDVFHIAKRYHVSPAALLRANQLEQPRLDAPARLLIPVVG